MLIAERQSARAQVTADVSVVGVATTDHEHVGPGGAANVDEFSSEILGVA